MIFYQARIFLTQFNGLRFMNPKTKNNKSSLTFEKEERKNSDNLFEIKRRLKEEAFKLGIDRLAITTAKPAKRLPEYMRWIENGYHGEMGYLSRSDRLDRRRDINIILPEVKSVIVVVLRYWSSRVKSEEISSYRGNISSYAWGRDYHKILGGKLKALSRWLASYGGKNRWYVDTGAIQEKEFAVRAGIGFIGKNTMLIDPRYGSGFFLGEIMTTLALPEDKSTPMPQCGSCQRCLLSCPTQAFVAPYILDATRCISYLTIELKDSIPTEFRAMIGNRIYGCDLCQVVCPWNNFAKENESPLWGTPSENITRPLLFELSQIDQETFEKRFEGTPIRRIKRERLLRNVAVALGNTLSNEALPYLKNLANDDSELIREHALWGLEQISKSKVAS